MALQLFLMQNHQVFGTCAHDGPTSLAFHPLSPALLASGCTPALTSRDAVWTFHPQSLCRSCPLHSLAFLLLHVALPLLLRLLHGLTPPTKLILHLAKCCFGQCNVGFYVASSSPSAGTPPGAERMCWGSSVRSASAFQPKEAVHAPALAIRTWN